ncbi:primase-helicase family protein [Rhizobium sp. 18055]|uniref:primase-helicase family protein n=1 Tax=Rhizobium sp. 18055 TaxID=2681403 RepID=UPI00135900DC|nr:primase-helicase family protein [Rhizobium sp. 18055]
MDIPADWEMMASRAYSDGSDYDDLLVQCGLADQPECEAVQEHSAPAGKKPPAKRKSKSKPAADDDALSEPHAADEQVAIEEFNEQYAIVRNGTGVSILLETPDGRADFMTESGFRSLMANKTVLINRLNAKGEKTTKSVEVFPLWMKSEARRTFMGVTFAPGLDTGDKLNLWRGFSVEPLPGTIKEAKAGCRLLLDHIKDNLCKGNAEYARYLMSWAADMIQDPGKKKGVALVLRGKKGVGKSMFVDALRHILGGHSFKSSQSRHLTGNFNKHMNDKLLIVAEESHWSGDKQAEGVLKDLITSDTITIEAKGVDTIEIPSCCRIAMITNNEWAVPASSDERRYFVLDVGEDRRGDKAYFGALVRQLENGGYEALLSLLMSKRSFPCAFSC